MKTEHGKYIPLSWDGPEQEFIIRGHLNEAEAKAEFVRHRESEYGDKPPAHGPWQHAYARWSTEYSWGERTQVLRTYDEPSPKGGRFKITIAKAGGGQ